MSKRHWPKLNGPHRVPIGAASSKSGASKWKDMTGRKIGKWHVLAFDSVEDRPDEFMGGYSEYFWRCCCRKCGHEQVIERREIRKEKQRLCEVCKESEPESGRKEGEAKASLPHPDITGRRKQIERAELMYRNGATLAAISAELGVNRETANRYIHAAAVKAMLTKQEHLAEKRISDEVKREQRNRKQREYRNRLKRERAAKEGKFIDENGSLRKYPA